MAAGGTCVLSTYSPHNSMLGTFCVTCSAQQLLTQSHSVSWLLYHLCADDSQICIPFPHTPDSCIHLPPLLGCVIGISHLTCPETNTWFSPLPPRIFPSPVNGHFILPAVKHRIFDTKLIISKLHWLYHHFSPLDLSLCADSHHLLPPRCTPICSPCFHGCCPVVCFHTEAKAILLKCKMALATPEIWTVQWLPICLRIRTRVFTTFNHAHNLDHIFSLLSLFIIPYWAPCCASGTPGPFLPQTLSICSFLWDALSQTPAEIAPFLTSSDISANVPF